MAFPFILLVSPSLNRDDQVTLTRTEVIIQGAPKINMKICCGVFKIWPQNSLTFLSLRHGIPVPFLESEQCWDTWANAHSRRGPVQFPGLGFKKLASCLLGSSLLDSSHHAARQPKARCGEGPAMGKQSQSHPGRRSLAPLELPG